MKRASRFLAMAGAVALLASTSALLAQDNNAAPGGQGGGGGRGGRGGRGGPGGGFDSEQMRQRVRDLMKVKDDAEWKIIDERITKVWDARREVGFGGGSGMRMLFRPPGGDNQNSDQGNRRRFGPEPSAEEQALETAINKANASKDELKAAMEKVREAKKDKESKLAAAQEELKKVLTVPQEAVALALGLVK